LRDFQEQVKSFRSLGGHTGCLGNLSDSQSFPENYRCSQVTANAFSVIGQKPIMGRDFLPEDERPGAAPVVILSYRLWEKRYGNDPAILGRTVRINGVPTQVIGVMPTRLEFPPEPQFWPPYIPGSARPTRPARHLIRLGR